MDERLALIRHRTLGRSETIRLRLQRVDALQAELWKRMDRLERERREYDQHLDRTAAPSLTSSSDAEPELTAAS